jgi:two-component system, cell cycle response regulator
MNAEGAFRMNKANLTCLLASPDPALLPLIEPILLDSGRRVEVALSAQTALDLIEASAPLALALIDANLQGMDIGDLLNRARASCTNGFPIVLITDTVTQEWIDRVSEGLLDDLILRAENPAYWQVRLRMALQTHRQGRNLKALREKFARNARLDRLTGVFNREALLLALSREIRHVRRTNGALSLLLLDIDDFGHWNLRLGTEGCDELLRQIAARTSRLLRRYDLIGRPGKDEFLLVLPNCGVSSAVLLADRVRVEVFCEPFRVNGESIRLSACFGISSSNGLAAGQLLLEAEQALACAKIAGPESIQCFGENPAHKVSPVTFLSAESGETLLAW